MSLASAVIALQSALLMLSGVSTQTLPQANVTAVANVAQHAIAQAQQAILASHTGLTVEVVPLRPLVEKPEFGGYATDGVRVFYRGALVASADLGTFQYIASGTQAFGKDGQQVYWGSEVILGANPKTFVVLSGDYAKDDQNVFLGSQIILGADPVSFVAP